LAVHLTNVIITIDCMIYYTDDLTLTPYNSTVDCVKSHLLIYSVTILIQVIFNTITIT